MQIREVSFITDSVQGLQREENRDALTVIEDTDYFLVFLFDGVSSYENSLVGIQKIIKGIEQNHRAYFRDNDFSLKDALSDMHDMLCASLLPGMYTTVCALYIPRNMNKTIKFSHLGDSRIYKYANGNLTLETEDHNLSATPHVLTKCLGMKTVTTDDFYEREIKAGVNEGFMLCTDGFSPLLEEYMLDYIKSSLYESDVYVKKTIRSNLAHKNSDDATYIIITIK